MARVLIIDDVPGVCWALKKALTASKPAIPSPAPRLNA